MRLKSRAKLGRRGREGRGRDWDDGKVWAGWERGNDGDGVGLCEQGMRT